MKFGGEPVENLPYFSHAISHLRKYDEVYSLWAKLKEMIDGSAGLRDLLEDRIRTEMRDNYPSLLEMGVWSVTSSNSYAMIFLSEKMYTFFREGRSKEILQTRRLQKAENSVYNWVIGYPQHGELVNILATDNEEYALENKLMGILNKLGNDSDLIQKFKNVEQENLEKHLKSFTVRVRELSENIELGHRIKGKCSIGY